MLLLPDGEDISLSLGPGRECVGMLTRLAPDRDHIVLHDHSHQPRVQLARESPLPQKRRINVNRDRNGVVMILIDLYTREGVIGRSYLEPCLKDAMRPIPLFKSLAPRTTITGLRRSMLSKRIGDR
jgi:hypothetical protein